MSKNFRFSSSFSSFITETNVKKATTNVSATAVSTEMTNDNRSAIIKGMRITEIRIEATFKVYQSSECCDKSEL